MAISPSEVSLFDNQAVVEAENIIDKYLVAHSVGDTITVPLVKALTETDKKELEQRYLNAGWSNAAYRTRDFYGDRLQFQYLFLLTR